MTPERNVEELRAALMNHEGRISSLESWRDNERARHASTPTWIFGMIAAAVGVGSLVLNLIIQFGARP